MLKALAIIAVTTVVTSGLCYTALCSTSATEVPYEGSGRPCWSLPLPPTPEDKVFRPECPRGQLCKGFGPALSLGMACARVSAQKGLLVVSTSRWAQVHRADCGVMRAQQTENFTGLSPGPGPALPTLHTCSHKPTQQSCETGIPKGETKALREETTGARFHSG